MQTIFHFPWQIKETFKHVSDSQFVNLKNKHKIKQAIQELQLSRNTVMRRIKTLSET